MQELHKQMERFRSEQMQLETRITELLPYQSEVAKLKGDLVKMQVRKSSPGGCKWWKMVWVGLRGWAVSKNGDVG